MTLRAHIFTKIQPQNLLRLVSGGSNTVDGVTFSFGFDVPEDIDALLVYNRASFSIQTRLPNSRTIFFAGEPDDIHPYSAVFLDQFGLAHTTTEKPLQTRKVQASACAPPFVGLNFASASDSLDLDWFRNLSESPPKDDLISIVTSTKADTPYHRARLAFIERLQHRIPDRIRLYGRGVNSIDDKKDALLGHKYHIALENAGGPFTWTEKLADPLLCWALPFHSGCSNVGDELPAECVVSIDITNPDAAIDRIIAAQQSDLWSQRLDAIAAARAMVFTKYNLMHRFAALVKDVCAANPDVVLCKTARLIRSERSLWPEPGCRGSIPEMLFRRAMLAVDPGFEMRTLGLRTRLRGFHRARKIRKEARSEAKFRKDKSDA